MIWVLKDHATSSILLTVNKTIVNESQPQTFPVNDECSPLLDHSDPKITNQQDLNLKQQENHSAPENNSAASYPTRRIFIIYSWLVISNKGAFKNIH